jgi:hypothetical protein
LHCIIILLKAEYAEQSPESMQAIRTLGKRNIL